MTKVEALRIDPLLLAPVHLQGPNWTFVERRRLFCWDWQQRVDYKTVGFGTALTFRRAMRKAEQCRKRSAATREP
jgi:hypothetical protein